MTTCTCWRDDDGRLEWVCEACLAVVEQHNQASREYWASPAGQKEIAKRLRTDKGAVGHPQQRKET